MSGTGGGAALLLGVEVCTPLVMLCWLCCWPDDGSSESRRRRSNEVFGRRLASSAASLHLPGTSGFKKQPLSAHRSHEEIRSRRKSHHETNGEETRYHSAPSVIDEVLHRRDWEHSTRELDQHIPLRVDATRCSDTSDSPTRDVDKHGDINATNSDQKSDEEIVGRPCKKHYTNIKTTRNKTDVATNKELEADDVKDEDVSELSPNTSNFYIGESACVVDKENINDVKGKNADDKLRAAYKAKDVKQSVNESIKCRDRPRNVLGPLTEFQVSGVFDMEDAVEVDRSGAMHHPEEPRLNPSITPSAPYPPPSVEAVGYESEASFLDETSMEGSVRAWCAASGTGGAGSSVSVDVGVGAWLRARHASAGDVLAPTRRPHSAALSESDLDFDLECCDDLPPAYDEIEMLAVAQRKETAI